MDQCAAGELPPQIRQLFVHIIVNYKVTDLKALWIVKHKVEDILLKRRNLTKNQKFMLNDKYLQFYALSGCVTLPHFNTYCNFYCNDY